MILFCGCQGQGNKQGVIFQDAMYGTGNRVHNPLAKADKTDGKFRCTICSTERGKPGKVESAKDKKARLKAEAESPLKKSDKKLVLSKS